MTTVSTTIANMMTGSDGDFADRRGPGDRKKYTVSGPVRRGRPLTSQTAFGGQLPYKGSLVRPAVIFNHNPFEYNGEFLRVTNQE
jgi:hypothetical protein